MVLGVGVRVIVLVTVMVPGVGVLVILAWRLVWSLEEPLFWWISSFPADVRDAIILRFIKLTKILTGIYC